MHVGWILPPFFHELPVETDDVDEAGEQLLATVQQVLPGGTDDDRFRMFVTYAGLLDELRDAGAVYAGFCNLDFDGRPSTATVAVYRMPLDRITAEDALSAALTGLQRAYPDDDVRISTLPSGIGDTKAVVRIGNAPFTLAAEASPSGEPVEVPRGQIQVYIPLPNDADLLVFELSTPCMEDWDFYSELFATIVRTLDWATEEEAELAAVLSGAQPVPEAVPDPAVVRALHSRSHRILEALAIPGRTDEENATSAAVTCVTCADCRAKGLESACTARAHWQIEGVEDVLLAAAVGRLARTFQGEGWTTLSENPGESVALAEAEGSGHRVNATLIPGRQRLVIEVVAPCTRIVRGPGDSIFG
ncbi:hypothetical protein GTY65_36515 [Streptomyces sp. SID8379]|nr:hypothetical protein [Streptomyces sp. SID8379]